jgi:hypothetical protein
MMTSPLKAAPPPRLSADVKHPWFDPYWSRWTLVRLDGHLVTGVVLADTIEGWAELYANPLRAVDDKLVTVRFRGKVEFFPKEGAP